MLVSYHLTQQYSPQAREWILVGYPRVQQTYELYHPMFKKAHSSAYAHKSSKPNNLTRGQAKLIFKPTSFVLFYASYQGSEQPRQTLREKVTGEREK